MYNFLYNITYNIRIVNKIKRLDRFHADKFQPTRNNLVLMKIKCKERIVVRLKVIRN